MPNLLICLYCILILGFVGVCLTPRYCRAIYRVLTLVTCCAAFLINLAIWVGFGIHTWQFQNLFLLPWLKDFNILLLFGIDGLSLFFMLLTTFIIPFCVLLAWNLPMNKIIIILLLIIELLLLLTFGVLDLFLFGVFFESLIIPIFFIIYNWGTRERRVKALTYFWIYTLLGSISLFLAIFVLYIETHSTNFLHLSARLISVQQHYIIWILLFLTFAIKIPICPFHLWLPEAHVEAPTVGSVILAGLLLKLGGYGILRFLLAQSWISYFYRPLILSVCILSILYASLIALRQIDIKRIIAYSSIAHINLAVLGLFTQTIHGVSGAIFFILSHGIVSSALFISVGVLYQRHHSRLIYYYRGIVQVLPIFNFVFFCFIISNFGFPGSSSFVSELLILFALADSEVITFFLILLSLVLTLIYSLLLYNKVIFGNLSIRYLIISYDLKRQELYFFYPLILINIILGLAPTPVLHTIHFTVERRIRGQWQSATGRLLDYNCDTCFSNLYNFQENDILSDLCSGFDLTHADYFSQYFRRFFFRFTEALHEVGDRGYFVPEINDAIYSTSMGKAYLRYGEGLPFELFVKYYYWFVINGWYRHLDTQIYFRDLSWMWQSIHYLTDLIVTNHVTVLLNCHYYPNIYTIFSLETPEWLDWLKKTLTITEYDHFITLLVQKAPAGNLEHAIFDCKVHLSRTATSPSTIRTSLLEFVEEYCP